MQSTAHSSSARGPPNHLSLAQMANPNLLLKPNLQPTTWLYRLSAKLWILNFAQAGLLLREAKLLAQLIMIISVCFVMRSHFSARISGRLPGCRDGHNVHHVSPLPRKRGSAARELYTKYRNINTPHTSNYQNLAVDAEVVSNRQEDPGGTLTIARKRLDVPSPCRVPKFFVCVFLKRSCSWDGAVCTSTR